MQRGGNYAWGPTGSCGKPPEAPFNTNQDGPSPILPALNIEAASGIAGARFCSGCGLGEDVEGRFLYVRFGYDDGLGEIRAATLNADRSGVVSDTLLYRAPGPSPLSLERAPDGRVFYRGSTCRRRCSTGTSSRLYAGGGTPATGDPGTNAAGGITLGNSGAGAAAAAVDTAEVVVYDRALDAADVDTVGRYLGDKYGLAWAAVS